MILVEQEYIGMTNIVWRVIFKLGFLEGYWLTLEQQKSLQRHHDLPSISQTWFQLKNGIHRAAHAQQAWLNNTDSKFLQERDMS